MTKWAMLVLLLSNIFVASDFVYAQTSITGKSSSYQITGGFQVIPSSTPIAPTPKVTPKVPVSTPKIIKATPVVKKIKVAVPLPVVSNTNANSVDNANQNMSEDTYVDLNQVSKSSLVEISNENNNNTELHSSANTSDSSGIHVEYWCSNFEWMILILLVLIAVLVGVVVGHEIRLTKGQR